MLDLKLYQGREKPTWCPGCVLPGTLIHTNPDLKPIDRLEVEDKVLGLDGRYHRVTEVFSHRHRGLMYRLKARCFGETVLTPEHPVLIARRAHPKRHNARFDLVWERADRIRKGDYLAYPIPRDVVDIERLPLPKRLPMDRRSRPLPKAVELTGEFLRLAGYYLAEGWIATRSGRKRGLAATVCFSFNIAEKEYIEDLKRIVRKLFGLKAAVRGKPKAHQVEVYIHSSRLARAFRQWFGSGAANKRIPQFMLLLPPEKQRELLIGLWRGDGWVDKAKVRAHYKTISKVLCEQLKLLLLRQGIAPSIQEERAREGHRASYVIYVLGKRDFARLGEILGLPPKPLPAGKPPSTVFAEGYLHEGGSYPFAMVPVAAVKTFDYDGEVWNLEVEDVQSYVSESAILHNCGDYGILAAVKNALAELEIPPHRAIIVSGIGCGSKLPHYMRVNGFHGIHGRALPIATGAKLANHELAVLVVAGDGDSYGIGGNHLLHACRRNPDITHLVQDNRVYGLTKGQYSPTSEKGFLTVTSPEGSVELGFNPLAIAIAAGASFVARGFVGDLKHLTGLIVRGVKHKGYALIDILQPCVTFNRVNTYEFYNERVYRLEETDHDPHDRLAAFRTAFEVGRGAPMRIPIGLFYEEERPTHEEGFPALRLGPLVGRELKPTPEEFGALKAEFL